MLLYYLFLLNSIRIECGTRTPETGGRKGWDKGLETNSDSDLGCGAVRKAVSPVIIGDAGSGVSMALLRNLGTFHIPLVRLSELLL